ncbi:hypothetical protein Tco_0485309 [Tanacetum coccineum]
MENSVKFMENNQSLDWNTGPDCRQMGLEVDNHSHDRHRSHITHKSMAHIGVMEGGLQNLENSSSLSICIRRIGLGFKGVFSIVGSFSTNGRVRGVCASWVVVQAERHAIDHSAGNKLHEKSTEESWELIEDLALYENESWNDPRDFDKLVKAISLPQEVLSTSDRRLIELENKVQHLMVAYLAPKPSVQVNKISSSCEICGGPHDTQYCMENPEQAFVDYASSRNNGVGGKPFTINQEPRNFNEATNAWKDKLNFNWAQNQTFTSPSNGSFSTYSSNVPYGSPNYQAKVKTILSDFDSYQENRLSNKFDNAFKSENRNFVVEDDKTVEKESKDSKIIVKEGVSNDIGNDNKASDLEDEAFKNGTKIEEEGEWMEYEPPFDLVDVHDESVYESLIVKMPTYYNAIGKEMHVFVGNMGHVMDFTILENVEANIDPSLSQVVFGRPFMETTKLILDREKGLITFVNEIKEVTFKTSYRDSEMDYLTSERHDLLSSRVILSDDDFRRGCESPLDLENGFYNEIDKLGPSYNKIIERLDSKGPMGNEGSRTSVCRIRKRIITRQRK